MSHRESMNSFIDVNAQEQNEESVIENTQMNIMQTSTSSQNVASFFSQMTVSSQNSINEISKILFIAILKARLKRAQKHEKRAKLLTQLAVFVSEIYLTNS